MQLRLRKNDLKIARCVCYKLSFLEKTKNLFYIYIKESRGCGS